MEGIMQLGAVGIGGTILIGIIAGWIAERVTGSDHGMILNLIFGIAGSWLGFFAANAAGIQLGEFFSGWFWGNLLVSAVGAIILLGIVRMIRGSKKKT
jgi:uncharacterized membrane protein YeaQ/YmgE (transglycosylase-associated protein family)